MRYFKALMHGVAALTLGLLLSQVVMKSADWAIHYFELTILAKIENHMSQCAYCLSPNPNDAAKCETLQRLVLQYYLEQIELLQQ